MSAKPLVSVIVPTYNSAEYIEACLKSITEQDYKHIELIVVDNNSKDNTKEIAKKYTNQVYNKGPERSAQRNFGVKKCIGNLVLIIDSDMELTRRVVSTCVKKSDKFYGLVIPEESFGVGFWAKCKKMERTYYQGIEWMEAARFFNKAIFREFGGYNVENTGTEDYDLPQRISYVYGKKVIGRINELIMHNERHFSLRYSCKKKYYYAKDISIYKSQQANTINFKNQSSIIKRYGLFFAKPSRICRHPILWLGMIFMKTMEFSAAAAGLASVKLHQMKLKGAR